MFLTYYSNDFVNYLSTVVGHGNFKLDATLSADSYSRPIGFQGSPCSVALVSIVDGGGNGSAQSAVPINGRVLVITQLVHLTAVINQHMIARAPLSTRPNLINTRRL